MRTLTAITIQIVLWLLMWTGAVSLISTIDWIIEPEERGNWIRAIGVATLALSLLSALWLIA